jgi:hypothetical protein
MWSWKCANVFGMKPWNGPESMQHAPMGREQQFAQVGDFWTSISSMTPEKSPYVFIVKMFPITGRSIIWEQQSLLLFRHSRVALEQNPNAMQEASAFC